MRRTVLIAAALLLVSASAQAGQTRNLSLASSHPPISAPLPPTPVSASKLAEAPPAVTQPAPAPVAAPAPVTAAPETGAPPVATAPVPPPLPPAATAAPAAAPAVEAPKYVERPTVAPATTETPKVDDGKPSRRAERRHRGGGYWSAGRIMGELRRYGYSYGGYGGW
jgi:hypothetical protein